MAVWYVALLSLLLTVLQSSSRSSSSLRASITIRPAITAFVVAIAGIMFPAIAMATVRVKLDLNVQEKVSYI